MPTVEMVKIYKRLANRPNLTDRHIEYVIGRIEKELVKRATAQARRVGIKL